MRQKEVDEEDRYRRERIRRRTDGWMQDDVLRKLKNSC